MTTPDPIEPPPAAPPVARSRPPPAPAVPPGPAGSAGPSGVCRCAVRLDRLRPDADAARACRGPTPAGLVFGIMLVVAGSVILVSRVDRPRPARRLVVAAVDRGPRRRDARGVVLHPAARRPGPRDPRRHRDDGRPGPVGPGGLRPVRDLGLRMGAGRPDGRGLGMLLYGLVQRRWRAGRGTASGRRWSASACSWASCSSSRACSGCPAARSPTWTRSCPTRRSAWACCSSS